MIHYSIIALAGPKKVTWPIRKDLQGMYDRIITFDIPDDYGEFPDTSGYTAQNWEQMQSNREDGSLFPFMTKCMDAVLEYTNDQVKRLDKADYIEIKQDVQWPKFGGDVFAVVGHVTAHESAGGKIFYPGRSMN